MIEWWADLSGLTQAFFIAAVFFSGLMLWQLIAALMGMAGGEGMDVDADVATDVDVAADVDADVDVGGMDHPEFDHGAEVDGAATVASFKLLSVRAILAFLTLFSWAGALYLKDSEPLGKAISVATLWGLGAMVVVAVALHLVRRLAESGTPRIATCLNTEGTVYLDIPADGLGEARVTVSGVVSHVRARGAAGPAREAGTPIRVTKVLGPSAIEVEPV